MKLIYCEFCGDVFNLTREEKSCSCGRSKGKYLPDGLNAEISGKNSVPLGFSNGSFIDALSLRKYGINFTAFVIPESSKTIRRI